MSETYNFDFALLNFTEEGKDNVPFMEFHEFLLPCKSQIKFLSREFFCYKTTTFFNRIFSPNILQLSHLFTNDNSYINKEFHRLYLL